MTQIISTAEPFLLPGDPSKPACLLAHGFTGTPKEMRWLGEFLQQHGYTSLGVRLTGHATRPEDMIRSRYTDWIDSMEDGYHLLNGLSNRVFMIGLSMGGVLSLLMSSRVKVEGIAAISTPYKLQEDPRLPFARWISFFHPYMPKSKELPGSGWFDKSAWKDHVAYPQNPVRSIVELDHLLAEMRNALSKVGVPVLLIHSKDDKYVPIGNMENIFDGLVNAPVRQKVYLTGSGHVVTRDAARRTAFDEILKFIQKLEKSSAS